MSGFKCPFCEQTMSIHPDTKHVVLANFSGAISERFAITTPHLRIAFFKCPNEQCQKHTVIARGENGYIDNTTTYIYPQAVFRQFPEYVPAAIRSDYEEACLTLHRSPKASATLARRCLQGMIRDFWKISGENSLYREIDAIRDKVPAAQWAAIDALRKIGNIGAHMEKDVNTIIDVEPDEAQKLLQLIELLIDKWYIARHDEESLYREILNITETKKPT